MPDHCDWYSGDCCSDWYSGDCCSDWYSDCMPNRLKLHARNTEPLDSQSGDFDPSYCVPYKK
jgi:hypothetical protein